MASDLVQDAGRVGVRLTRRQTREQTRRLLLESAGRVFRRLGYHDATLDKIAADAGFTKGALYWHFPNKQAVFLALVADAVRGNVERLNGLYDEARDAELLKRAVGKFIDRVDEDDPLPSLGVDLEIEARRNESFRVLHQRLVAEHETALKGFLERYFATVGAEPPMPLHQLAASLITIFKGFALARSNRPDSPASSAATVRILLGLPPAN